MDLVGSQEQPAVLASSARERVFLVMLRVATLVNLSRLREVSVVLANPFDWVLDLCYHGYGMILFPFPVVSVVP